MFGKLGAPSPVLAVTTYVLAGSLLAARAWAGAGASAGYADKSLGIEGFAQMRWQLDHKGATGSASADDQNTFRLRRLRFRATGDWNRYFRVRLQLALQELAKDDVAGEILEDAFIRFKKSEAFELHFGQYKLPISREELRSSSDQLVVDRSPIVNDNFKKSLWISRDVGLVVAGNLYERDVPFEYYAGVWNGEGRNNPAGLQGPQRLEAPRRQGGGRAGPRRQARRVLPRQPHPLGGGQVCVRRRVVLDPGGP